MGHVRCADIVRDSVDPCAQGTAGHRILRSCARERRGCPGGDHGGCRDRPRMREPGARGQGRIRARLARRASFARLLSGWPELRSQLGSRSELEFLTGFFGVHESEPQRLKPHSDVALTARLKSCPSLFEMTRVAPALFEMTRVVPSLSDMTGVVPPFSTRHSIFDMHTGASLRSSICCVQLVDCALEATGCA